MRVRASELDRRFDNGEDITRYLEMSGARRPGQTVKRVNIDFPVWMVNSLDKEARRMGVPRQSIIKVWVAERLLGARRTRTGGRGTASRVGRQVPTPRGSSGH